MSTAGSTSGFVSKHKCENTEGSVNLVLFMLRNRRNQCCLTPRLLGVYEDVLRLVLGVLQQIAST